MPGTYAKGEHDIAGCITGVVERNKIITGDKIKEGDLILGLPSSGLHTNGYSLARRLLFKKYNVHSKVPDLEGTIGENLLKVHTNYTKPVLSILDRGIEIRGIAHITGGGFIENIPRILPSKLDAEITLGTWPILPIFTFLQKLGKVKEREMYTTFNMGIGMVLVVSPKEKIKIRKILKGRVYEIGQIIKGSGKVILK
jgi:phosphoribosylformylglycinamidine cyclo-ligase